MALGAASGIEGQDINIATGTEISMADTLGLIAELMGADVEYVVDQERLRPTNSEVMRLCGDSTRIRRLTGWQPEVSLEEGLRRTIEWFTEPDNLARYKSGIYNR